MRGGVLRGVTALNQEDAGRIRYREIDSGFSLFCRSVFCMSLFIYWGGVWGNMRRCSGLRSEKQSEEDR